MIDDDRIDEVTEDIARLNHEIAQDRQRISALEDQIGDLEALINDLKTAVQPDTERKHYADMDRGEKVHRLRVSLLREAQDAHNGKSAYTYKDVKTVFDGHPSNGHCYDLMEDAGNADGFEYDTNVGGSKVIRVNMDAVEDDALVRAANKTDDGVTA